MVRTSRTWSIPASAGEPRRYANHGQRQTVYPRECGGTATPWRREAWQDGLSPRVRGNLSKDLIRRLRKGSIPASAGEPKAATARRSASPVYPRECGGTSKAPRTRPARGGLSPRVRGNLQGTPDETRARRSIPASAGEPSKGGIDHLVLGVYPRECGGTCCQGASARRSAGLSPRVRGNRLTCPDHPQYSRSIPASAGEPVHPVGVQAQSAIYPRECGGTTDARTLVAINYGLSPRVRGNPASTLA